MQYSCFSKTGLFVFINIKYKCWMKSDLTVFLEGKFVFDILFLEWDVAKW